MKMEILAQSLDCGQCFRWNRLSDGSWEGVACGKHVHITEKNLAKVLSQRFWAQYFDMGLDYDKIRGDFCRLDPVLAQAAQYAPDMRILNQDPWEALCSFILSQCNNIKRIKGMVARLCAKYGSPFDGEYLTFPTAEVLASADEEDLRSLGFGYRASYVLDAARKIASGTVNLDEIKRMPLEEARLKLTGIEGVGTKVADCALLYGLHRLDAFPMDVWMKRAMKTLFPGKKPEWFGPYAGIAQQYLFHYSRNHPELFQK